MDKILHQQELEELLRILLQNKSGANKTVLCHGVFDLVHPGHLEHFKQAKKFGEILFVGITADKFINKGPNRPFFNELRRASFLAALEIVDYVFIVDSDSALPAIQLIKPNFYAKGPDYRDLSKDITGKINLEKQEVERYGGQLVFTDGFTSSSTVLINSSPSFQDSELRKWVSDFKSRSNLRETIEWIDQLKNVEVNILGETIIDVYTSCAPLSKTSKDPILAFHRLDTRKYLGGVLAIADSCSKWSKGTRVTSVCGDDFNIHLREIDREINFELDAITLEEFRTIVKHRYFDKNSGNRVFEYYDFNPEFLPEFTQERILKSIQSRLVKESLFLIADYGHGFFGEKLISDISMSDIFLSVNAQANAGNRGFNTFSKYPRIDFLSLNGGELELEFRKKNLDYSSVVPKIMKDRGCRNAVVTLGGDGLLTFDAKGEMFKTPAFASKVVDKVGAGDSVLAIASMLSFLAAPKEVIGLLASVVAAFEVAQLGHASGLDIVSMKKFIAGILG